MTAFEWFSFAAFAASLALSIHHWRKQGASATHSRRGPNMSGTHRQNMGQV